MCESARGQQGFNYEAQVICTGDQRATAPLTVPHSYAD